MLYEPGTFVQDGSHPNLLVNGLPSFMYRGKDAEDDGGENPKDAVGSLKPSTWSVMPRWVMLAVGRVMSCGAAKYGAFNFRETKIRASVYEDAIERHLQLWFDGEDNDPETGVSHLASVMASCALLMDAQRRGMLADNRQKTGLARPVLDEIQAMMKP
ncbi:MAG: dATP/dGTP diphosphohydrolase domain-containing protein [Chakrabartia sp.]